MNTTIKHLERIRKNRESARRSIEKKRIYTENLEKTVNNLREENSRLIAKIAELEGCIVDKSVESTPHHKEPVKMYSKPYNPYFHESSPSMSQNSKYQDLPSMLIALLVCLG